MELSSSKIQKLLIFLEIRISSLKFLLYFKKGISELKKKSTLKKFLMFPQRKVFLIFWKNGTLLFQKMKLSSSKIKRFQEGIFQDRKIKKLALKFFFIFWKMNFLAPSLKNFYVFSKIYFFIFQEETCKV